MKYSRNEILKTIGERIKEERKKIGLTQAEFSEKLRENGLEANRQKIAKWESGIQHLQDEELITLANYFNVSTDYLLGNSRERTTDTTIKGICEYTGLDEGSVKMLHDFIETDKNDEHPINVHLHLNTFITAIMPIVFMHFNDYIESCRACAYIEKKYQKSFLTADSFIINNGKAKFTPFTFEEKNVREFFKKEIKEKQDLYLFYTQKTFLSYVEDYGDVRKEITTPKNYEQYLDYCEKEGIKTPIIESVKKINELMKNLEITEKQKKDESNGNDK